MKGMTHDITHHLERKNMNEINGGHPFGDYLVPSC